MDRVISFHYTCLYVSFIVLLLVVDSAQREICNAIERIEDNIDNILKILKDDDTISDASSTSTEDD